MSDFFLCVGDLDVDLLAEVARLPALDDKVAGRRLGLDVGGMAANVAVGLARLGSRARLVAAVGDDDYGDFAVEKIAAEGVDIRFLQRRADTPTFMCVALLTESGEKALIRLETDAYLPRGQDLPAAAFAGARHVHLTLGSVSLARRSVALAKTVAATLSLDLELADLPAPPDAVLDLLAQIDWLFVNLPTYQHLLSTVGEARLAATAPRMIVTLGARGCRLHHHNGSGKSGAVRRHTPVQLAGHAVAVRDSTGAGDAFAAAFLHYHLARRLDEVAALRHANAAAALAVQHYGAQTGLPDAAAVASFLAADPRPAGER